MTRIINPKVKINANEVREVKFLHPQEVANIDLGFEPDKKAVELYIRDVINR